MPEMDGIEFLKERKKQGIRIPVVVLSSIATQDAEVTLNALSLGASDFIQNTIGVTPEGILAVKDALIKLLFAHGGAYRHSRGKKILSPHEYGKKKETLSTPDLLSLFELICSAPSEAAPPPVQLRKPGKTEVIAIGVSAGGPSALMSVLSGLDKDLNVPVLVVQHIPDGFSGELATSLDRICPLDVKEAEDGDTVKPGRILIAQGNRHMEVEKKDGGAVIHLSNAPLVSGHRPSADVLFASVARVYQNHALGVIMTGMGRDGAKELGAIYREGGLTLGQDEASALVYGMPRVAYEMGHVMEQVPLEKIARRICDIAKESR
jgi:two-component system chemotaxis response regulator CheB